MLAFENTWGLFESYLGFDVVIIIITIEMLAMTVIGRNCGYRSTFYSNCSL